MRIVRACVVAAATCFVAVVVAGCSSATDDEVDGKTDGKSEEGKPIAATQPGETPNEAALPEGESPEPPAVGQTTSALTWKVGWHYVTWPTAGLRRWNSSSCGGTVHCTLRAGQWVYWAGGPVSGCGGTGDAYVHNTPCGFSGYIRQDALN